MDDTSLQMLISRIAHLEGELQTLKSICSSNGAFSSSSDDDESSVVDSMEATSSLIVDCPSEVDDASLEEVEHASDSDKIGSFAIKGWTEGSDKKDATELELNDTSTTDEFLCRTSSGDTGFRKIKVSVQDEISTDDASLEKSEIKEVETENPDGTTTKSESGGKLQLYKFDDADSDKATNSLSADLEASSGAESNDLVVVKSGDTIKYKNIGTITHTDVSDASVDVCGVSISLSKTEGVIKLKSSGTADVGDKCNTEVNVITGVSYDGKTGTFTFTAAKIKCASGVERASTTVTLSQKSVVKSMSYANKNFTYDSTNIFAPEDTSTTSTTVFTAVQHTPTV